MDMVGMVVMVDMEGVVAGKWGVVPVNFLIHFV